MFSEEQKKIALALFEGPLALEEIAKHLTISGEELQKELERMLELKVLEENEGIFSLKKEVVKELQKRKELSESDSFKLRLLAYIELQALEEEMLSKQLNSIVEKIKQNDDVTVYSVEIAPIEKQQTSEYYSSYIEVNFTIRDFTSLIQFMFYYGPSTVEVLKPGKMEIQASDLQDALAELSDINSKYTNYIASSMNKKELEEFNKKIQKAK